MFCSMTCSFFLRFDCVLLSCWVGSAAERSATSVATQAFHRSSFLHRQDQWEDCFQAGLGSQGHQKFFLLRAALPNRVSPVLVCHCIHIIHTIVIITITIIIIIYIYIHICIHIHTYTYFIFLILFILVLFLIIITTTKTMCTLYVASCNPVLSLRT